MIRRNVILKIALIMLIAFVAIGVKSETFAKGEVSTPELRIVRNVKAKVSKTYLQEKEKEKEATLDVKVTWAKVNDAEGYEVVFTSVVNKKTVTWKYNRKTKSISFSSFPKRNGYNVTVRAYKTVDGQKQYGDYSVAKTFDVK